MYFGLQINPPYFVPLVEMVPSPWTRPEVMATTRSLMEEIGQSPVSLNRECPGFALNRIQYACINEAWNMYQVNLITLLNHFVISSLLFQPKQYLLTNQGL